MGRFAARKLEEIEQANVIRRSIYFDRLWYLERHPELARVEKGPGAALSPLWRKRGCRARSTFLWTTIFREES